MLHSRFAMPAPAVFVTGAVLSVSLEQLWPLAMPRSEWLLYGGWLLLDAGLLLLLWTAWLMLWRKTTLNPYGKPQRLLTTGPFRLSRNPVYSALLAIYLGVGVLWGSGWSLLVFPLLVGLLQVGIVRYEECRLLEHFGEDYRLYCQQVRRWF